jgi:hypothetical protein
MNHLKDNGLEIWVMEEGQQPYKNADGRYFVDGEYNIVKTCMIEVAPLSSITEDHARDLCDKHWQSDSFIVSNHKAFLKSKVSRLLRKIGKELINKSYIDNKVKFKDSKDYKNRGVPPEQILVKSSNNPD